MEYLFCFICYLYTLLTIIDTTNTNTTRVHVISSTCKMHNGNSDCSKYDLQICYDTRNRCPERNPNNQKGCFEYVTYIDLKADKDSMQHFQPPSEKIRSMRGFVIVVVNRGSYGQSSADFITTSCETSRTVTTNGINITTSIQNGQPSEKTFNFELNIEMDCAISSCYGQECEICVTTRKTTAYTSSNDQTTHYSPIVETGNSVSTQHVKASSILPTQGVKTSTILPTQKLTIIGTTNINTTRVHVISSTCKMDNGYSDCSKYDLQICHTRNICPRKMPFNPQGCFDYVTYTDLKADKGSMQHFQPPNEKIRDMTGFFIVVVNRGSYGQSSGDFITTSCEISRTDTTNGINITTTNVQIGQPSNETFNFELNIEMDCAISSCYGQECEICAPTVPTKITGLLNNQSTTTTDRHDVSCNPDSMSVYIPSALLSQNNYLTWTDPHCKVINNGTHYISTVSHTACGTIVKFTHDEVIFENDIFIRQLGATPPTSPNDTIDFGSDSVDTISVQCIYPRRQNVTMSYRPANTHIRFYEKRYGHMDVQLEQYQSDKFVSVISGTSYPREVLLNKDMYIKLRAMHTNTTDIAIKVDSCVATPSAMPADGSLYQLIDHGCPASPAVKLYPSSFDEVKFSVKAFQFKSSPGSIVYIHCQISVCSPTNPQCVTGCKSRHRRDVDEADDSSHLVSGGPYLLVADKGSLQMSTVVAGVCACLAVVATVFAVIGWKRKSTKYNLVS